MFFAASNFLGTGLYRGQSRGLKQCGLEELMAPRELQVSK
jgi:hypothetical protein